VNPLFTFSEKEAKVLLAFAQLILQISGHPELWITVKAN